MKVSVIIINYNTFQLTSNCIRSVMEQTRMVEYEIILVDNASAECDPDKFKQAFPSIKLIKSDMNGGFAAGNNLGIQHASGDLILLLNSDTVLTEDSIGKIVNFYRGKEKAGVVGCRMTYPDQGLQYTARRFRSISWELLDIFRFILWTLPYRLRSKRMLGKYFLHDENMECDWLNGAFFLFPKRIIGQLPQKKLDDRFFMYGEDQLWCEQFKRLGYQNFFYAGTSIIHINSGSTSISKQLNLRKTMMKHELEIMRQRKGRGIYYYCFLLLFGAKESTRNFIKFIVFKISGKLIK